MNVKTKKLDWLIDSSPILKASQETHTREATDGSLKDHEVVVNLSHYPLNEAEKRILNRGLSFCPTKKMDKLQLCQDIRNFERRVRLREYFDDNTSHDSQADSSTLSKPRSKRKEGRDWTPPSNRNKYIDSFIDNVDKHLDSFLRSVDEENVADNLSAGDRRAIKSLQNNDDIIIKPADKGGAVTVQDKDNYTAEAQRQLSDDKFYTPLTSDPTTNFIKEAEDLLTSLTAISKTDSRDLLPADPRPSRLYLLPKIHKLQSKVASHLEQPEDELSTDQVIDVCRSENIIPPGRPIISNCGSLTELMSAFVDKTLQKYLPMIPSYVRDTTDFLNKIKIINEKPPSSFTLVTMDVTSLYTNICHEDGINATKEFLLKQNVDASFVTDLTRLTEFILKHNYFTFDEKMYLQTNGTAMGTKMAPSYANIFMCVLEESFLSICEKKPLLYLRYIDDIFMIWTDSDESLMEFVSDFGKVNRSIKFTMKKSQTEIDFLDVKLKVVDGNKISTTIYHKPTDKHTYLRNESFHPTHCRKAVVYSQFLRYRRIISDNEEFEKQAIKLGGFFLQRGYPIRVIKTSLEKARSKNRDKLLTNNRHSQENAKPSDRIPLVTTYHPSTKSLIKTIYKDWEQLSTEKSLPSTFSNHPINAQKQPPNLRNILVKSSLAKKPIQKGNLPCNKPRCQICKHMLTTTTMRLSPSFTISPPRASCDTENVVYCIKCSKCPTVNYIGETGTKFRLRFNNHKNSIKHKLSLPVAEHFNTFGHSLNDVQLCIIGPNYKNREARKLAEMKFITKTRTFETGLNRDMGWLSNFTFYKNV